MKHRKKLMILLTLTACMVLFCSFPVFAAELTEGNYGQVGSITGEGAEAAFHLFWECRFRSCHGNQLI